MSDYGRELPDGEYLMCECGALPDGRNFRDGMGPTTPLFPFDPPPQYELEIAAGTHAHKYRRSFKVSA